MPIAPGVALGLTAATLTALGVGGYALSQRMEKNREEEKKKKKKKQAAKIGRWSENAALGNTPEVVAEVSLPIQLGELGPVTLRMPKTGSLVPFKKLVIHAGEVLGDGAMLVISPTEAIKALVTNLHTDATKVAWTELKKDIRTDGGVTFDVPSFDMDKVIRRVLTVIDPTVDWAAVDPTKFAPASEGPNPKAGMWAGVSLLGELLYQSIWNREASKGA